MAYGKFKMGKEKPNPRPGNGDDTRYKIQPVKPDKPKPGRPGINPPRKPTGPRKTLPKPTNLKQKFPSASADKPTRKPKPGREIRNPIGRKNPSRKRMGK